LSEHDADHCKPDEGGCDSSVSLVISRQASVAADPGQGSLDDPALGEDHEAMRVGALHDLKRPVSRAGNDRRHPRPRVAAVADDALDERKPSPGLTQQAFGAVSILDARGMDIDVQQEALRIDEDVTLAAEDLLARVVAGRVDRTPPFTAPFVL
jgi:hypothetical protein